MSGTPIAPTPWKPSDLPTLRAAYSDRTAALMAYLAAFVYDRRIEAKGVLQVPPELAAFGFDKLTSFHNGMTDGWAYIAEGADLIALSFRVLDQKLGYRLPCHSHPSGQYGPATPRARGFLSSLRQAQRR